MFGFRKVVDRGRGVVEPTTRLIRPGLTGFKQFLMRGNIVDLAVAVVIGTAFTAVVKALVDNLLTPLIAAIGGKPDFAGLRFTIHHSVFRYGLFLNALVTFMIVAATVYFFVVLPIAKANDLRRRGHPQPEAEPAISDEARLLTEIRDLLAGAAPRPPSQGTEAGAVLAAE
ncbi:Large-conductance mechanosensitive channel [Frankia canadensis]|uniref:Large-conductance mechanosensitive channel n=1 Tax=Frankia canadensis TaxID=1836972 RepID=A0A2I2KNA7_9ACTN|nr:large conductance mechanosensitive channel protein MscL [Frankia canadensis]SNQ47140.1 Large-conductance mechanosensitive channel [Frankia canadensis]SOU54430.1 Large-conductance mechanosensitive channel [Frankia canadensis]